MSAVSPFKLLPALHVKVWGGRRLASLGKALPTAEPYGESWEVHDTATIASGPHAGKTLGEMIATHGEILLGAGVDPALGMPLLLKFLDANEWLSIQVHPNDRQAQALDNQPRDKTEAWYVRAADPGAQIVIGVQPGTTPARLMDAIRGGTLEGSVVYADVTAGDVLFIPAGTIHALGPGLLIYEIQQSSDLTYRLYDWGRMGLDGQPRPLHIEKSAAVSNLASLPPILHTADSDAPEMPIISSPFFNTTLYRLMSSRATAISTRGRFQFVTCIEGEASLNSQGERLTLTLGETVFVPASVPGFTLESRAGARLLRSEPAGV
jgi:mannose-6-phosphate isomerase